MPEMTSPRRVSIQPPALLLDEDDYDDEDEDDEGPYGVAYSPSQLRVKYQDTDTDEEYYDRRQGRYGPPPPPPLPQNMVAMPVSILNELKDLLVDYNRRFPSAAPVQQPVATEPSPRGVSIPPPPALPAVEPERPLLQPQDDDQGNTSDEQPEVQPTQDPNSEWYDYIIPDQESPVPDPIDSPPVDIGGFHSLMDRAAARFGLAVPTEQTECFLYDFKEPHQRLVRSIPIIEHVWAEGVKVMHAPATVIPVLPRLDKKYKAPADSPAALTGQPKPDSVISQAAQRKSRNPSAPLTTPSDKEGRRLDNVGKRFSSMASLLVRASNALAILGRFDRQMWSDISPFIDQLPDAVKPDARKILEEGERTSSEIIDCAMDIATTAFRSLAGAAVLRRQGWLRATWFRPEIQNKILDLPYDGDMLFGKHVDDTLQDIKKDTETARSLGTLQYRKTPFRGARGRGSGSYRGNYQQQRYAPYSQSQTYKPQYSNQYGQQRGQSTSFSRQPQRGRQGRQARDSTKRQ